MIGLRLLGKLALVASVLVRAAATFLFWHHWSVVDLINLILLALATWLLWFAFKSAMNCAQDYWCGRYTRLEEDWTRRYQYLLQREEELLAKMEQASAVGGLSDSEEPTYSVPKPRAPLYSIDGGSAS